MDKPIKHSYCVIPDKVYTGNTQGRRGVPVGVPPLDSPFLALSAGNLTIS